MLVPERFNQDTPTMNPETGEVNMISAGSVLYTPEDLKRRKKYAEQASISLEEKDEKYKNTKNLRGQFYSILCKGDDLLPNVSDATLNKLIFLATYIDKHGRICKDAVWHKDDKTNTATPKQTPLTKEEIREVLQISRPSFTGFWKECIEKQMIMEKPDGFYLPRSTFRFCETVRSDKKKTKVVKVFKHAIRYMYTTTDERTRKWLTHLYRLIPFINLSHNVLCTNPFESDVEKIVPLTLGEMCDKLGIDRKNQTHLLRGLTKLQFVDKQGDVRSVIRFSWEYYNGNKYTITINPQFYSGYISEEDMIAVLDDFKFGEEVNLLEDYGL